MATASGLRRLAQAELGNRRDFACPCSTIFKAICPMRPTTLATTCAIPLLDLHQQLVNDLILHGETNLIAPPARLMPAFALAAPDQAELAVNTWHQFLQTLQLLQCSLTFFGLRLDAHVDNGNMVPCDRRDFLSPDQRSFTRTPAITVVCKILIHGREFETAYVFAADFPFMTLANRVADLWLSCFYCVDCPFPWDQIETLSNGQNPASDGHVIH
jgi:hypothetical protein